MPDWLGRAALIFARSPPVPPGRVTPDQWPHAGKDQRPTPAELWKNFRQFFLNGARGALSRREARAPRAEGALYTMRFSFSNF